MNRFLLLKIVFIFSLGVVPFSQAQNDSYPVIYFPTDEGDYEYPEGYQIPWDEVEIRVTERFSPNLVTLHGSPVLDPVHPDGSGGRAMVLYGPDGVLMVDAQNRQVQEKTLAAIRSLSTEPIRVLVNSHVHSDHTGANAFFGKQGALIFAQENLRLDISSPRPGGRPPPEPDPDGHPVVTYEWDPTAPGEPAVTLNMNGEIIDFIPMMPSHTAGDTIVRFRNANVIYIEDFYRNYGFPFAAQNSGGTMNGIIEAVDLFRSIADDDTWLVPGHGTLIKRDDLIPYRDMMIDVVEQVTSMRNRGASLEEVLAANLTAPYEEMTRGATVQNRNRFIRAIYIEAGGLSPIVNGRRASR